MSLDNYVAFFVAGSHDALRDMFHQYRQDQNINGHYTIAYETSKNSHAWCGGAHIHVLVEWSDKQYRAFIAKLKSIDFPMHGRATKEQPRTYGKVRAIADFKRMLAYTIKGNNFQTNEDSELIEECMKISFEKEDEVAHLRQKINDMLDDSVTFTKQAPMTFGHVNKGFLYPEDSHYTLLGRIKYEIVRFFRHNQESYKMPCKSKVMYLAQYYLMYHRKDVPHAQILELFY